MYLDSFPVLHISEGKGDVRETVAIQYYNIDISECIHTRIVPMVPIVLPKSRTKVPPRMVPQRHIAYQTVVRELKILNGEGKGS